jgi:hypothetical protein
VRLGGARDRDDPRLLGEDASLGAAPPQAVFALERGHRLHGVGAADGFLGGFGHAEMFHLAGSDQVLDGAGDVLDRHVGVDPVLVVQVDHVASQSPEGPLDGRCDLVGTQHPPARCAGGRIDVLSADREQRIDARVLIPYVRVLLGAHPPRP